MIAAEMDAFDADVLIYAAAPEIALGAPIRALFDAGGDDTLVGIGSMLLIPEVLTKPLRAGEDEEARSLAAFLGRLDLAPVDRAIAQAATALGARHGLKAADAVHLATAISLGADRFITNNRKDFGSDVDEIDVVRPADLGPRKP